MSDSHVKSAVIMSDELLMENLGVITNLEPGDILWVEYRSSTFSPEKAFGDAAGSGAETKEGEVSTPASCLVEERWKNPPSEDIVLTRGMDIKFSVHKWGPTRPAARFINNQNRHFTAKAVKFLVEQSTERLAILANKTTCSAAEMHLKSRLRDFMSKASDKLSHVIDHYTTRGDAVDTKVKLEEAQSKFNLCVMSYDQNNLTLPDHLLAQEEKHEDGGEEKEGDSDGERGKETEPKLPVQAYVSRLNSRPSYASVLTRNF